MQVQQPQRPTKNAAASNSRQHYNRYDNARSNYIQWCNHRGVIAPALIPNRWVTANTAHENYKTTSLGVMLTSAGIRVKCFTSGECFVFLDAEVAT